MTYPSDGDSHGKLWVILDKLPERNGFGSKGEIPPEERLT